MFLPSSNLVGNRNKTKRAMGCSGNPEKGHIIFSWAVREATSKLTIKKLGRQRRSEESGGYSVCKRPEVRKSMGQSRD